MTTRKRALLEPADDWQQLQPQLDWPEQNGYELIRPVVVFGRSPVERSQQVGRSTRTIYRKVERFDQLGRQSLFETGHRSPQLPFLEDALDFSFR